MNSVSKTLHLSQRSMFLNSLSRKAEHRVTNMEEHVFGHPGNK